MQTGNLYLNVSPSQDGERFDTLLTHKGLVIERIVSSSRITLHEYIQSQDEWVALLQGEALLDVAGKKVALKSGDYMFLPSNTPHTVLSVSDGAIWLAIHLHEQPMIGRRDR
jgi:cupin 2 domain-containing protein